MYLASNRHPLLGKHPLALEGRGSALFQLVPLLTLTEALALSHSNTH